MKIVSKKYLHMMVKKLKKQKHILFGRRQLFRNIVFCLNKATLPGIATSLILYQL